MGRFGKAMGDLGMQTAQGIIGTGMGLLMEGHEDRRQLRQQEKLQELEMKGSKEMTAYNTEMQKKMQLEMWNETSYPAQMAKMKEAGINPALMYGMGGGGGVSTGGSLPQGNVKGGEGPKGTGTSTMMGLEMAQMGLLRAQKENIEADTENKKAGVPKLGEETKNVAQDTKNKVAQEELTRIQSEIAKVAASVSRQTINEQMKSWENLIKEQEARINNTNKDTQQKTAEIELIKKQTVNEALKSALITAQTNNTNESTRKILSEIENNEILRQHLIQDLWINRDELSIKKAILLEMQNKGWDERTQNEIDFPTILPIFGQLKGILGGKTHTPIKGFGQ